MSMPVKLVPHLSRFFPNRLIHLPSLSRNLRFPSLSSSAARSRSLSTSVVKSLVEDEADLSDWVSGLHPGSLRTSVYSSDEENSMKGGKRRREGDSDGFVPKRHVGMGSKPNSRGLESGYGDFGQNKQMGMGSKSNSRGIESGFDDFGQNKQMGRGSKSNSRGVESGFGENKQMGRGSKSNASGVESGYGDFGQNKQMGRGSKSNSRGIKSGYGDFGKNRQVGKDLKSNMRGIESGLGDFGTNRQMGKDSKSNPRGRERFGNGVGEVKRGGKGLSRGRFLTSGDEDDGEGEKLNKSFLELINEDSEDDSDEEEGEEGVESMKGSETLFPSREKASPGVVPSSTGDSESYLSETRFDQCSVSPLSLKGIKDAGYEKMTVVQEATLPLILKGKDVLAKAKTGTGKTVAFLLPSIELVAKLPPASRDQKRPPILVLVMCPTRELANQASNEADKLLKYHPSIGVQVVIGGTRLALEQKRLQANPCQILVATPGRLKDHVENTAGFATRLMGVKVLVLDEADHLLDMGFRKDIEKIIACVPKQRQTLLFSATVPSEVRQICHIALKRDHEFVDTVGEGTEQTHAQVKQMHLIAPLDKQFSLLYAMLKDHIADDVDYKVLVFCTTAMVTKLVANLLGVLKLNVREIHSRKAQSYRTKVSDEFRKSKGLILVTSDVSARGVDYPDVTLVIQVGLPAGKEQYIHRLGRTGRKGKEGQGVLLLAPWEEFFLTSVRDLPISKAPLPLVDPETKKKVERALSQVEMKNKEAAYQAWLGYYNSNKTVARDKCKLVELANEFSRSMGLNDPPAIPKLVLGKMGLKNVPGLRSK